MTWAEDRATRRRDPSADSGARIGDGMPPGGASRWCCTLRDWHHRDKSRGVWGAEPPGRHLRWCWELCAVRVSLSLPGRQRRYWIAVRCVRVRSQPFFWHGAVTDACVCLGPCPAAPHTHPFVHSTAERTA